MGASSTRKSTAAQVHHKSQVPIGMLNDLEFAYAPIAEKVRDLREYL